MATKLYLHRTEISSPGTLPSSEQSTLAPDANLFDNEDGTENRLMDKKISTSAQTTLQNTQTADTNPHNYYIARWVSPLLASTSVSANTWTVEMGIKEANANANFPRSGAGADRICAYVWKPSNGTKYGNILDGNTAADGEEATTSQTVSTFTFSGSAVSSLTAGDAVIVFELWAIVTQGTATARIVNVYYDGTTENSTSNEAAWISTPQDLNFAVSVAPPTETVTVSSSVVRLAAKNRAPSTETVSISSSVTRTDGKTRAPATQTVTVGESLTRQTAKTRTISETTTIGESLTRLVAKIRALSDTIVISSSVTAEKGTGSNNVVRTLTEDTVISSSVTRQTDKTRAITETTSISDSVTRQDTKNRTLSDTVSISSSVTRQDSKNRSLSDIVSTSSSISRLVAKTRALTDTVVISSNVNRLAAKIRNLATQTVSISDDVQRTVTSGGNNVVRTLTETVNIGETLTRQCNKIRTVIETVSISESLTFVNSNTPAIIVRTFAGAGAGGRKLKRLLKRFDFTLKHRNFKL